MSNELNRIRTDVVGSLLRPAELREARARYDQGAISAEGLRVVEDAAIRGAIELQQAAGLDVATDGEFRRLNFQDSFGEAIGGYDSGRATLGFYERQTAGAQTMARFEIPLDNPVSRGTPVTQRQRAIERLYLRRNLVLDEYRFSATVSSRPVKVSLVGPDRISQRIDLANSAEVYATMDDFLADVVRIERQMIESLVQAGCRYVQIDEPGYTAYVDEPSLQGMRERGRDPWANFSRTIEANNLLIAGFDSTTFGIHLCRGNQRSMWHREGSYDAIAERLFSELKYERFLLEYDSPRAGSFEPLRFVPKGKMVVLGLISTKVAEIETVDGLKRRIDEAAKYLPLEQLALSPQCGFASDFIGNLVSEDDQKRKLEVLVETARQMWGSD
jgi:5-methyltetrahydropteroyltriglutamate--homocysteine methyltransferase